MCRMGFYKKNPVQKCTNTGKHRVSHGNFAGPTLHRHSKDTQEMRGHNGTGYGGGGGGNIPGKLGEMASFHSHTVSEQQTPHYISAH